MSGKKRGGQSRRLAVSAPSPREASAASSADALRCAKTAYDARGDALAAMPGLRAYVCTECRKWHLTSRQ